MSLRNDSAAVLFGLILSFVPLNGQRQTQGKITEPPVAYVFSYGGNVIAVDLSRRAVSAQYSLSSLLPDIALQDGQYLYQALRYSSPPNRIYVSIAMDQPVEEQDEQARKTVIAAIVPKDFRVTGIVSFDSDATILPDGSSVLIAHSAALSGGKKDSWTADRFEGQSLGRSPGSKPYSFAPVEGPGAYELPFSNKAYWSSDRTYIQDGSIKLTAKGQQFVHRHALRLKELDSGYSAQVDRYKKIDSVTGQKWLSHSLGAAAGSFGVVRSCKGDASGCLYIGVDLRAEKVLNVLDAPAASVYMSESIPVALLEFYGKSQEPGNGPPYPRLGRFATLDVKTGKLGPVLDFPALAGYEATSHFLCADLRRQLMLYEAKGSLFLVDLKSKEIVNLVDGNFPGAWPSSCVIAQP